jgi:hypothetical protein
MSSGSNLIGKVLAPALRFWLRSQVDTVKTLELDIQGKDGQILRGHVPGVQLNTEQALYRGLQLGKVLLRGENIRINMGQIIKGKPLRLLEPIQVWGTVQLSAQDLQASLTSELLSSALKELLITLLQNQGIEDAPQQLATYTFTWQAIALQEQGFTLQGWTALGQEKPTPLVIRAQLSLGDGKTLYLRHLYLEGVPLLGSGNIEDITLDLGTDVELEAINLSSEELSCLGCLLIRP